MIYSDEVANSADRPYRPAHHKDYISSVEEEWEYRMCSSLYPTLFWAVSPGKLLRPNAKFHLLKRQ